MKIVLDTNVFIFGVFFSGLPFKILKAWRDRHLRIVVSAEILEEYRRAGACALAVGCKVIVSGDKLLRKVSGYGGIKVMTPRVFIEHYLKK